MVHSYKKPQKTLIAFLISQSILSTAALAAGFQINEISARLQGDATAGAAAAFNDVSSMFVNPATLSTLQENQGYLGFSEILPSISMSNARATHAVNVPGIFPNGPAVPVQGLTSEGSISPNAFVPSGYVGWRFTDKLVGGFAMLAPYGLKTRYSPESVVRFAAQYSAVQTLDLNPALAYAINDKWSVGAGFQAQYILASFTNFNGAYTGTLLDLALASQFPTHLKGDAWGYGYTLGVFFKPQETTRIGIGYRSQISESLNGTGEQYVLPGAVVPAESQDFLFNALTSLSANIKTPQILTISAAQDIDKWTVKASVQGNFWTSFNELNINMPEAFATNSIIQTQWQDSWFGALGAEYHKDEVWTVRGGVAYDATPTQDAFRDPRIPDANRVWLTAGASYYLNKNFSIDAAYAHIFMQNQTVNVVQSSGTNAITTSPLETNQVYAEYQGCANIVALAARYSFN